MDALTLQNIILGLDNDYTVNGFKNLLSRFMDDMDLKCENMDDNDIAYIMIKELSTALNIDFIESLTDCPECGSENCEVSIKFDNLGYSDKPILFENETFILSFSKQLIEEDMTFPSYISSCMDTVLVKKTGQTHKVKELENDDDIDNILSFISDDDFERILSEIFMNSVVAYSSLDCKDCGMTLDKGISNLQDLTNILIEGFINGK